MTAAFAVLTKAVLTPGLPPPADFGDDQWESECDDKLPEIR